MLRDFDLQIAAGETVAFVGHTGAGKTTVSALVNRSYDIEGGAILIDGIDLRQIQRASLTRRMSVVLQEPYLFSGTIADNIRYGRLEASDEEIAEGPRARSGPPSSSSGCPTATRRSCTSAGSTSQSASAS